MSEKMSLPCSPLNSELLSKVWYRLFSVGCSRWVVLGRWFLVVVLGGGSWWVVRGLFVGCSWWVVVRQLQEYLCDMKVVQVSLKRSK